MSVFTLNYHNVYQKLLIGTLDKGLLVYTCTHLDKHSWREASQNTDVGTSCTWTNEDSGTLKKIGQTSKECILRTLRSGQDSPNGILRTLKSGQVSLTGLLRTLNIAHVSQRGTLCTSECAWGCA